MSKRQFFGGAFIGTLLMTSVGCSSNDTTASPPSAAPSVSTSSTTPASPSPSDGESTGSPTPATPSPTEAPGPLLSVTIQGDEVQPNSKQIKLKIGQVLTIQFDADRAGELHVHSTPEQFIEFEKGQSVKELVIDAPGVVEVEEHDTSHVVASLEVR